MVHGQARTCCQIRALKDVHALNRAGAFTGYGFYTSVALRKRFDTHPVCHPMTFKCVRMFGRVCTFANVVPVPALKRTPNRHLITIYMDGCLLAARAIWYAHRSLIGPMRTQHHATSMRVRSPHPPENHPQPTRSKLIAFFAFVAHPTSKPNV